MNITNPKVAIFFLAFLPQFTNPGQGDMALQILALGGLFIAATFGRLLQGSTAAQRALSRVASVVFIGLAVRLATVQR